MTENEAGMIAGRVIAAFPRADFPKGTLILFRDHLRPLPYERTAAKVRLFLMAAEWPPHLSELLGACGVDSSTARMRLAEAITSNVELTPDLAETCGWTLGAPRLRPGTDLDSVTAMPAAPEPTPPAILPEPRPIPTTEMPGARAGIRQMARALAAKGERASSKPRPWEKPAETLESAVLVEAN